MGYGRDVSRYTESKRVVKDKNLGPLVSTDMTRCIQCTRCVRFGEEIAGIQELGTVGRGELLQISTYVEKSVDHELSGNIIDLCPVGALNNKPYRYRARAWEMTQHPLVSPHDCVGTNLYGHVLRGRLMRVVPRANEEINETWIADRDRFSCEGLYTEDRARRPMQKIDGEWREIDWETALANAATALRKAADQHGVGQIGFLVAPGATLEEHALAARLARGLGCLNVDHRLQQVDFRDQDSEPAVAAARLPYRRARDRGFGAGRRQQPSPGRAADRTPPAQRRGAQGHEGGADRAAPPGTAVPGRCEPDEQRAWHGPSPGRRAARRTAPARQAGSACAPRCGGRPDPASRARADRGDAGHRRAAPRAPGRARAASSRVVRDPRTGRGARRGDRRPPWLSARGRKRGRRCAGGDDSAPRCRRTQRRTARSVRDRDAGRKSQGVRTGGRDRSGRLRRAQPRRGSARGRGLRHFADAVRGCGAARAFHAHPSDRRLRRDLGHLDQRRGTLAERCGRGASAGRSAARLEGAARARQPAWRGWVRLSELRGRSQRASRGAGQDARGAGRRGRRLWPVI